MKKTVKIEDRGRYIYFKNRKIRTPVTLTINESELKELKMRMRMSDIQSFKVQDYDDNEVQEIVDYDFNEPEETVIEELEDEEPKTLLEKYMKDGDGE